MKIIKKLFCLTLLITSSIFFFSCNSSHSKSDDLQREAQKEALRFWDEFSVKCGDSVFAFDDKKSVLPSLYEFKSFTVIAKKDAPIHLTEAQKLNQEEENKVNSPGNVEWQGKILLSVGANRQYSYEKKQWDKWQDLPPDIATRYNSLELEKVNGQWVYGKFSTGLAYYDYFPEISSKNKMLANTPISFTDYENTAVCFCIIPDFFELKSCLKRCKSPLCSLVFLSLSEEI